MFSGVPVACLKQVLILASLGAASFSSLFLLSLTSVIVALVVEQLEVSAVLAPPAGCIE